ncbi:MAG: hypothetical protein GC162_06285 [Planctomycetes bacterium]|nr:hypothetical protein [Planctomycetota bacterium]
MNKPTDSIRGLRVGAIRVFVQRGVSSGSARRAADQLRHFTHTARTGVSHFAHWEGKKRTGAAKGAWARRVMDVTSEKSRTGAAPPSAPVRTGLRVRAVMAMRRA